ncbi:Sirohydrochlorin ferrochelatase [Streptomyces sp. WMMB 714]|uniref:sirohydrochlorin chelatase n=1 Tax=Streptomyces sp. WMMB 714 TaxID=1286822 RepID=UPI000823A41A|nr:CbiX/SirB N-terminal domain-containing protein [Streptomyces sp. WMMB 714]SCK18687.1 Sirohydrochlorin ferrochelatase [Streptomyces sp. WMMB 714]
MTLDSSAQLMARLTAQLRTQLLSVRAPHQPRVTPEPPSGVPVLVAAVHGSRDPEAARTVEALLASVRAMRPELRVVPGYIELNEPSLSGVLAALPAGQPAVVVPLLFGRGHHVDHDLPRVLADAPHVGARAAQPLGPHPLLAAALYDRLLEAGWPGTAADASRGARRHDRLSPCGPERLAVVLAAAGSRCPAAAEATERTAWQLRRRLGGDVPVVAAYASAARPSVGEAVRALRAGGHSRVAVASCFVAPGHFAAACASRSGWISSAPIGDHPALVRLVLHRYDEARAALPADSAGRVLSRAPHGTRSAPAGAVAPAE